VKSRNVSASDSSVKVILGPLINHISKILKKNDDGYGSGLNNEERAVKFERWSDELLDFKVVCADGSAFDSTQHKEILEIVDKAIYTQFIDLHPEIADYCNINDLLSLVNNYDNSVVSDHYSYKVIGTQMTGAMNTSQGNTTRSLMYLRFIYHMMGEDWQQLHVEAAGDDTIMFLEADKVPQFIETAYKYVYTKSEKVWSVKEGDQAFQEEPVVHGLGQIAKLFEVYDNISGAEYLSMYLLQNQDSQIKMVRKPERFIQLTPFTLSNNANNLKKFHKTNSELMIADANNILASCYDVNFFRAYADAIYRLHGASTKAKGKMLEFNDRTDTRSIDVNFEFEELMQRKYGITSSDLDEYYMILSDVGMYEEVECLIVDKLNGSPTEEKYNEVSNKLWGSSYVTTVHLDKHMELNVESSNGLPIVDTFWG